MPVATVVQCFLVCSIDSVATIILFTYLFFSHFFSFKYLYELAYILVLTQQILQYFHNY